jgi:NAD(P)-dependent dehydrogenase (short-subunit alcohol dehydrogenase family)
MVRRGKGTIVFTSATAAVRGNAGQHAHAAAMSARRSLAQSLAAELNPKGVHVCHVNIDSAVNAPESIVPLMRRLDTTFERRFQESIAADGVVEPTAVADTYD